METEKITISTKEGPKQYTYLGCPLTRNRSAWCYRLCAPDGEGHGRCGRVAPHGLSGRTQLSIKGQKEKAADEHFKKLEHSYLSAPCNEYYDPGVRISRGEAEVLIAVVDKFLDGTGSVHESLCFTALNDAARLAVGSMVENAIVVTTSFNTFLFQPVVKGELIARARFLGISGDRYLAEAVLRDADGNELGRGNGAFVIGDRE